MIKCPPIYPLLGDDTVNIYLILASAVIPTLFLGDGNLDEGSLDERSLDEGSLDVGGLDVECDAYILNNFLHLQCQETP